MSFAESFWTHDYESGFNILFDQLHEGVSENDDFIRLFSTRMDAEYLYGKQLDQKYTGTSKRQNNDDYVSTIKNTYQKINDNFTREGAFHVEIANNIKVLVLDPFEQWCREHKKRIEYSESAMLEKYKAFKQSKISLDKIQKKYFNKCRMLEEFKSNFTDQEIEEQLADLKFAESQKVEEEDPTIYKFGNTEYDHKMVKRLLLDILTNIELKDHKVPILGTYRNVSTGSSITQWLLDNIPDFTIAKAELFGQDLITNGFIRSIGTMGTKTFINSSQYFYQWKPIVFEITDVEDGSEEFDITRKTTNTSQFSEYFEDMKEAMGVKTIDINDRTQLAKLIGEVSNYDEQYYSQAVELDKLRCEFEEFIMDHLTFMQKCELDRLKAIKKVTFDFIASFSNKISTMKHLSDELLVLEETIHPVNDLKFLIENYATGRFKPQVILYDNYYDSNIRQTFGVDLSVKSRLDKKVVPILIQCILSHMDKVYPEISNDDERINLWTKPVQLSTIHKLRFQLNDVHNPAFINDILQKSHPIIITNVLKLYFLELPDSIIPSSYYDVIQLLYANYPFNDETKTDARINGVQNVLVDLPNCNLATLDAILTHLKRLINIIGTKDNELAAKFQESIYKEFVHIILRSKDSTALDVSKSLEKTLINFITDLFIHKERIFKELRRRNSSRNKDTLSRDNSTKSAIVASKSRLESRLQNAVKTKRIASESRLSTVSKADDEIVGKRDSQIDFSTTIEPTTPPPSTPKKSSTASSLKRSTSPNKKKLSSHLSDIKDKPAVVSSRPLRKDIEFSGDVSDGNIGQPKYTSLLGRKGSVKDLASKFDSPEPTTERS